jgi:U2-associated protein SR140
MSAGKGLVEFPDVEAKLQKPTKKSAFEKQRAEAEAKRQREAAETAAVYEDFVKSFDRDDNEYDNSDRFGNSGPPPPRRDKPLGFGGGGAAASRRHFGASSAVTGGLKSGPGSLGPPPGPYGKKRGYDAYQQGSRDRDRGILGFEDRDGESLSISRVFNTSDDEDEGKATARAEELAIARPTLRLAHLPPGTSPAVIKSLMPPKLTVEDVKIIPGAASAGTERKCTVAIVTLSQGTPANDIDTAVSYLQNRYLGYGYYLSLHRHLSSAVSSSTAISALVPTSSTSQPFGAKPVSQPSGPAGNGPTAASFHRGFAPPSSYGPPGAALNRSALLHVPVNVPNDVKMLQMINKTIELVLEHGPEFEAILMTRPEVQREEKWAWIWDARSEGGIWYRWRLWEIITGSQQKNKGRFLPLFDGSHAWKSPDKPLAFEYITELDEFISDSEYNSSEDDDFDGEGNRESHGDEADNTFLNPLEKAKLTHLLARLPTTLSRIRKGDIARVTTFALTHASRGADEVVETILSNVEKPLSLTAANLNNKKENRGKYIKDDDSDGLTPEQEDKTDGEALDTSAASLVGLYVVSDILSSSSTSGLRHAWRFRQLFEVALKERKIFECLGAMPDKLRWGRLRAEKWKRSVGLVLNLWDGWCVFPAESHELFVNSFENPVLSGADERSEEESSKKRRWKLVEAPTSADVVEEGDKAPGLVDGRPELDAQEHTDMEEPLHDADAPGEPLLEEDIEGEPMDEEDIEGEPMEEDEIEGEPMDEDEDNDGEDEPPRDSEPMGPLQTPVKPAGPTRKRMRAADMFADSGGSDSDG